MNQISKFGLMLGHLGLVFPPKLSNCKWEFSQASRKDVRFGSPDIPQINAAAFYLRNLI